MRTAILLLAALNAIASPPLALDYSDDGKQLKLLVRHAAIGPVCELWSYEGGPFNYGTASKANGAVVFVHKSRGMTATTTFTPEGDDRVLMDIVVEGPLAELQTVRLMGPCMQFWHSQAFQREDSLVDFARRCFIYTMRGPVGMLDTARGLMSSYKRDAPENNPPVTQWYVPAGVEHPGDIWSFGASGDRPLYNLVGVTSKDGKWLSAIGCLRAKNVGQGWHDCVHHVPVMQPYLDERNSRIVHRTVIYVMPNDKAELLKSFRRDFPEVESDIQLKVTAGEDGTLNVKHEGAPEIQVAFPSLGGDPWKASFWGGFVRSGPGWTMWANPTDSAMEISASFAKGSGPAIEAALTGDTWRKEEGLAGVPAVVRRTSDGWTAALMWEKSDPVKPEAGVPLAGEADSATVAARGRLYLNQAGTDALPRLWEAASTDWKHAFPFRMPVETSQRSVTFAPNAEDDMTYGLTIVPPWQSGGTMHINFPEHLEYTPSGRGILRHHDKRANPWKIAADGLSASYAIESMELPGVRAEATATSAGGSARLSLKITNGSKITLDRVKPLLCFWYAKLTGFPAKLSDNFKYIYVVKDGKATALASIPTENPAPRAMVAYVRGCTQHDCDQFARSRGGLIESDIDRAWIAVTALDGNRKAAISFTPGKSILSNAVIPCAHADPFFGTIEPGASASATGEILFTERGLDTLAK